MRVRCIANSADAVPQYLGVLFFDLQMRFQVTIGSEYAVLGIELYRDALQILVPDDSDFRRPQWLPIELFDVVDDAIAGWHFKMFTHGSQAFEAGFRARWGYAQLVDSDRHRDGLEGLDRDALAIFGNRLAREESARSAEVFTTEPGSV